MSGSGSIFGAQWEDAIREATWPRGVGRIVLDRTDSTMAEAARRAGDLDRATWIMAAEQTAARGRRGRVWHGGQDNGRGNFAATLAMPGGPNPARAALRSFLAALALHDACQMLSLGADGFALKWPNDVLLNEGKLAGILLERMGDGTLLIGFGVNLVSAPTLGEVEPGAVRPVSLAGETGHTVSPARFLDVLAPAFAEWDTRFVAQGFAPIREAWLDRAARLGQPIRARSGHEEVSGVFETIDETGQLVVATDTGPRSIAAADVFFD